VQLAVSIEQRALSNHFCRS